MVIIGVQGNQGSFSESAALDFIKRQNIAEYNLRYLISSYPVLQAIESGDIEYGIIAIENAQGGVVIESIQALARYRCDIIDMFHILVRQNLLVRPGVKLEEITSIHSHQQALRQCRNYLAEHFWSCCLVEEKDTAEAARQLHTGELPSTAAVIASKACAQLYDLTVITEDIHDLKNNLTLFLGVKKLD